MPLAWNEIRHRAIKFANENSKAASEAGEKQTFWNEFFEVLKGNGPCNRERLRDRRRAYEDGAWVREAALAHAAKQAARVASRQQVAA